MANRKRGGFGFSPSLTGPGTIFTLAFIALSVGMGLLFSRGVAPKSTLTDPGDNNAEVELIMETPIPGQKGLQLKTLKFKECSATTAVSMQLDITGSLGPYIEDLKKAVLAFTDPLSDDSILGIQSYNSGSPRTVVIPIESYKLIKDQVKPAVMALRAGGSTPSYDAILFSGELLKEAQTKFPDRKFNYIFFSDGNPNVGPSTEADLAAASKTIKDLGITVYAVGLGNINASMIQAIASSPDTAVITSNSKELERIYKEIAQKICNQASSPTPAP